MHGERGVQPTRDVLIGVPLYEIGEGERIQAASTELQPLGEQFSGAEDRIRDRHDSFHSRVIAES